MIICSCQLITKSQITETAARLRARPDAAPLTPECIFTALGYKPNCRTCVENFVSILRESEPEVEVEPACQDDDVMPRNACQNPACQNGACQNRACRHHESRQHA